MLQAYFLSLYLYLIILIDIFVFENMNILPIQVMFVISKQEFCFFISTVSHSQLSLRGPHIGQKAISMFFAHKTGDNSLGSDSFSNINKNETYQ